MTDVSTPASFVVNHSQLFGFGGVAFFRPTAPGLSGIDEALASLATKAAPEEWNDRSQSDGRLPVLSNYLRMTFRRLHEEGKLVERSNAEGQVVMAFNTGLYTPLWQEIYGCFRENSVPDRQPWYFLGWFTEAEWAMKPFVGSEPERAEYFTDPSDLLFDPRLKFVESVEHILDDNVDRYPPELQVDPFRRHQALNFAVGVAKKVVGQNWQVAVPMYYFNHGPGEAPTSLLLPLCLMEADKADMALVVGRYGTGQYKAFTVLDLSQAYQSARLLAKPTASWLGRRGTLELAQPVLLEDGWRAVSEWDRCPVCGGSLNCSLSVDNFQVQCRARAGDSGELPARLFDLEAVPAHNEADR